jgi:glycerol-3-phosphate acyltransferase PlsY
MMAALILHIIPAYLLGSISGSLLLGKLKKVDIRQHGSGNAGGTNALRTQGLVFALGVVVIDIGKGFMAAWWIPSLDLGGASQALDPGTMTILCSFAAVLGHCFPVWHNFRGGKGAATAVGTIIVIEPWLLLPVGAVWLVTLIMTGYVGLATVLAGLSLIPGAWWMSNQRLMLFSSVLALFLLFTHRGNIRRLRDGTEHRFESIYLFSRKH